jgi:hypothetical protein
MKTICSMCECLLVGLAFVVWFATLPLAKGDVVAMVATTLLPVVEALASGIWELE